MNLVEHEGLLFQRGFPEEMMPIIARRHDRYKALLMTGDTNLLRELAEWQISCVELRLGFEPPVRSIPEIANALEMNPLRVSQFLEVFFRRLEII